MDEARLQAYIDLIEQLLTCSNKDAVKNMLQANQELIDWKFLQLMEKYADWLGEKQPGDNRAIYLRNIAQDIAVLNNSKGVNNKEYQVFLQEVLSAEIDSDSDPKAVYPILQRHQHLLDYNLAQLLEQYVIKFFSKWNRQKIAVVAQGIGNLCIDIQYFPLGIRVNNIEIAIIGYQVILESLYTREAFPEDWAATQNHLGIAYEDRIIGKRAENLELAITAYKQSLTVFTREANPEKWAETQMNLGNAYCQRIVGKRAENLELAITAYKQSLEVRTNEKNPENWANSQINLGNAYCDRIKGEKAGNLELAIAAYEKSLEVYTCKANPEQWATIQNNLGNAYWDRIKGEKAENLELAIAAHQKSLKIRTRNKNPEQWAETQNNLGIAYEARIRGENAENLELAITAYKQSLEVRTREANPEQWAITQNNLGSAYSRRIRGKRSENLELAIAAYQQSLEVRTREASPEQWANSHINLGNAYRYRIKGEKAENLELAITAYQQSLEVHTREADPERWANLQNSLGGAYRALNQIPEAIEACRLSLEIYTPKAFPISCLGIGRNLAHTANHIEDWETAIEGYNFAIEAVETSRSWATTPQRKQEIMEAAIDVYTGIIQACVNNNQYDLALEYVERSKNRNLVELLANCEIYPKGNIDQSILRELDRLRQEIHVEQRRLDNEEIIRNSNIKFLENNQPQVSSDRTHLNEIQQELDELIKTKINPDDDSFSLTQKVETIPYSEIQSLINQDTAILEFYLTNDNILAFIITSNSSCKKGLTLWQSSSEDLGALKTWMDDYLNIYRKNKTQWIETLSSCLENLSDILHINNILKQIPSAIQQLIIIPHRFLHILPLHALPIEDERSNNIILQDRFLKGVKYNPSCQLLKQVKQRQRPYFNHLFALQNPTEDLLFTDLEVTTIQQHFDKKNILVKQEGTKYNFNQRSFNNNHCSHFSCHGYFNVNNPLQSALILANAETSTETKAKVNNSRDYKSFPFREGKTADLSKCLTLEDIFKLELPLCRLVTLSACETGLIDTKSLSDEYIGLPSGFLFAGSPSIVSSLWTVDDFSTAFLMIKFYENLRNEQKSQEKNIAVALKNAQNWLRNLTPETGEEFFKQIEPYIDELYRDKPRKAKAFKIGALKRIKEFGTHPFAKLFDWAAFTVIGL